MRYRAFSKKSKILAILCCFALSVSMFLAGIFMMNEKSSAYAQNTANSEGLNVLNGASIRYDVNNPGLKWTIELTKDQYEAYISQQDAKLEEGTVVDNTWSMFVQLTFAKKYGVENAGSLPVFQIRMTNLHSWFAEKDTPYEANIALFLNETWNDGENTSKTNYELYKMYAETEVYVNYIAIDVHGTVSAASKQDWADTKAGIDYKKSVKAGTLNADATTRSARTVASALYTRGLETDYSAIQEKFMMWADESNEIKSLQITENETKLYYDNYKDKITIVGAAENLKAGAKVYVNAHVADNVQLANEDADVVISGVNAVEGFKPGSKLVINFDAENEIYSYNNVIDATEIFYNNYDAEYHVSGVTRGYERMQEVFGLTSIENIFQNQLGEVDVVYDENGNEIASKIFYNVDRGYYVLGESMSFGLYGSTTMQHNRDIREGYHRTSGKGLYYDAKGDGDYTDPEDFNVQREASYLSGSFGFGGTFDGNGNTISIFQIRTTSGYGASGNPYNNRASGFFGALAYGATIKDVAFDDIRIRYQDCYTATNMLLATYTGSNITLAESQPYLKAKYGVDESGVANPSIIIDNCYFKLNTNNSDDTNYGSEQTNTGKSRLSRGTGIIQESAQGVTQFTNCVFNMGNQDPVGLQTQDGGAVGPAVAVKNDNYEQSGIYKDCYSINTVKTGGKVLPVWFAPRAYYTHKNGGLIDLTGNNTVNERTGNTTDAYDYVNNPVTYKAEGTLATRIAFAKNDAEGFDITQNETKIYYGLDTNKTKWVVEPEVGDTGVTKSGYAVNMIAYIVENVNRFASENEMIFNNTANTAGFSDSWTKVGGAVKWGKNSIAGELTLELLAEPALGVEVGYGVKYNGTPVEATIEKTDGIVLGENTFTVNKVGKQSITFKALGLEVTEEYNFDLDIGVSSLNVVKGKNITYTLTSGGATIDADVEITGIDASAIDKENKTITFNNAGTYNITISAFGYSETFTINVLAEVNYDYPVVFSAKYSAVKDSEATEANTPYGVPYIYEGKDLIKSSYLEIYQLALEDNSASLTNVYTLTGETRKEISEVKDGHYKLDANANRTVKTQQMVLVGDKGTVTITNQEIITLVIEDADGFNYINNDATTMAGSYYLAKDFDDRDDETIDWNALTNSELNEKTNFLYNTSTKVYDSGEWAIGYSFGYTPSLNANGAGELAFHGLFDGLGHTISNLQVEKHGLMGVYNAWQDTGAILRNVKFDNMSVSSAYFDGTNDETTGQRRGAVSYQGYMVLGMSTYKATNTDVQTAHRVYIEDVIINLKSGLNTSVEIVGHRASAVMQNLVQGKFDFTDVIINMPVTAGSSNAGVYQGHAAGGSAFVFGLGTGTVDNRFPVLIITNQGENIDNLVVINAPHPGTKRIPMITGTRNGTLNSFLVMYANDYDKYIGENGRSDVKGGTTVYSTALEALTGSSGGSQTSNAGWGEVKYADGTKAFVIVPNVNNLGEGVTWVSRHKTNQHSSMANTATNTSDPVNPSTIFLRMNNMNRYDTYAQYVGENASVQHGNWLVNADGTATWNPVA